MCARGLRFGFRGFTLLELMTAILVISILVVMIFPVINNVQSRMEKVRCVGNLRSLHVAANLYVQEHHSWPQIPSHGIPASNVAASWINALQPYGLAQINFICPTTQRLLGSPDLTDPNNARLDYLSTPFDSNPQTPFKWSTQPWFIESGNVHGNGNLIIFPDGHVEDLYTLMAEQQKSPNGSPAPGH